MKYFFVILLMISLPVIAEIGSVTEQEGQSSILRQKASLPSSKGTKVEMLDVISTGKGKTSITFQDNTKVNVTENSKLVIDDFVYDPKSKGTGKLAMKVALGTVRYASGSVAHENPNNVKINTPTATIAVRGTDFVMSVDEIGRSTIVLMPQCDSLGICKDGLIDVTTAGGTVTLNKPYQATVVESNRTVPPPPITIKFNPSQVNNTNLQIGTPKTESGASLIQAAREAIKESQKSSQEKSSEKNNNPVNGISGVTEDQAEQIANQSSTTVQQTTNIEQKSVQMPIQELLTQSSHVTPIYKGQQLIGWQYLNISQSQNENTWLKLPKDSLIQIVVVQDYIQDVFQFANKPTGSITIRQTQK
jgi:hypothetical protein